MPVEVMYRQNVSGWCLIIRGLSESALLIEAFLSDGTLHVSAGPEPFAGDPLTVCSLCWNPTPCTSDRHVTFVVTGRALGSTVRLPSPVRR